VVTLVEDCGSGKFPFQVIYQICSKESKEGGAQSAALWQATEDLHCLVGGNAWVQNSQFNILEAVAQKTNKKEAKKTGAGAGEDATGGAGGTVLPGQPRTEAQ
jgi:hypothetical protein